VALGTAAALTAAGWGLLARQEKLVYEAFSNEARFYAQKSRGYFMEDSEALAMCKTIRGMDTSGYRQLEPYGLPPKELEYYVLYKRADMENDAVGREMMNRFYTKWSEGKFRCTELHPDVPFLYKKMGTDWFPR
jgi:hypothetical protein